MRSSRDRSRVGMNVALVASVVLGLGVSVGCNAILGNGYGVDDSVGAGEDGGPGGNGEGGPNSEGGGGGDGSTTGDGAVTRDGSLNDGRAPDGGTCPGGECPVLLHSVDGAQRLAIGATGVYWASLTGIGRVDFDGTNPLTYAITQAVGANLKRGIAVTGTYAYATMPGGGKGATKCPTDLSACDPIGFIGSAGAVSSIAADAAHAYVGVFDDQVGGAGGIWQTPPAGAPASAYTMMTDKVLDLQIVGTTTYFRTSTAVRANTLTTAPNNVVNLGAEAPLAFVIAGANVYVATDMKHIQVCTLSPPMACTGSVKAITTEAPTALAADATHLYWAEAAGGTLHRCDLPSCTNVLLLAENQAAPSDIVLDATSVYWADFGTGATGVGGGVLKLTK